LLCFGKHGCQKPLFLDDLIHVSIYPVYLRAV
jgi:hypothetical protein